MTNSRFWSEFSADFKAVLFQAKPYRKRCIYPFENCSLITPFCKFFISVPTIPNPPKQNIFKKTISAAPNVHKNTYTKLSNFHSLIGTCLVNIQCCFFAGVHMWTPASHLMHVQLVDCIMQVICTTGNFVQLSVVFTRSKHIFHFLPLGADWYWTNKITKI